MTHGFNETACMWNVLGPLRTRLQTIADQLHTNVQTARIYYDPVVRDGYCIVLLVSRGPRDGKAKAGTALVNHRETCDTLHWHHK